MVVLRFQVVFSLASKSGWSIKQGVRVLQHLNGFLLDLIRALRRFSFLAFIFC